MSVPTQGRPFPSSEETAEAILDRLNELVKIGERIADALESVIEKDDEGDPDPGD